MNSLRFPLRKFEPVNNPSDEERNNLIAELSSMAPTLRNLVSNLEPSGLCTPYREGGWTVKQIVHHLADNDMNAYLRFKRGLTEDEPMSSTFREDLWAELSDYKDVPVENSLLLIETLHDRFLVLLQAMRPEDFQRNIHTQVLGRISLDAALQRFVWHDRHHIAQIESFIKNIDFR
ncbi:YfiT family bacillithiol transferase [Fontibacillus sp. BL9]|uniref:YfiT family bacillithiol transferase n=1 Tax=Fontibacillus sp. BL9 TaxID=3389971 RepID=UPI00397D9973